VEAAVSAYTEPGADLIRLLGVTKEYESVAGSALALKGIDLTIRQGEFVAIVGRSGSGKSTLMNMIAGIDLPTSGEILVDGTPVHKLGQDEISVWRGRTIGVVFQFFQLLPTLTVAENVMLPMDFARSIPSRERRARAMQLLTDVGVAKHAGKLPETLSGGEQQRAAIARALANDPPIIVADEPTGNLDEATADSMFDLFNELVAGGKTLVMVTHERDVLRRVGRAVTIADGSIHSDTAPGGGTA
jgi:putative ABC transport system ATP-binding protein